MEGGFRSEMSPQWYYKVVNSVGSVVRSQYDGFVLPVVLLGRPEAAVFADLRQLEATKRFLLTEKVAEGGTDADIRRDRWKAFYYSEIVYAKKITLGIQLNYLFMTIYLLTQCFRRALPTAGCPACRHFH